MTQEKVDRINFLAHKAKSPQGLTPEEKEEQRLLRQEFIEDFRRGTIEALKRVDIQEPDGTVHPLWKD